MVFKSPASLLASPESLEQQLITMQKRLYLAWGVFIGFTAVAVSVGTSYLTWVSAFVWLALLIFPALMGFALLKLPKWQNMPLVIRKNTIISALGVSFLTTTLVPLAILMDGHGLRNPLVVPIIFLLGISYGWLTLRLERQAYDEPDEMFP
jgi:hypothetical protein